MNMRPLVISGPSGSGKSYLVNVLTQNYDYKRVVPVTTREPRIGEINGESYYFVTQQEYEEIQASGEFFMSNTFFNAQYGIQRVEVNGILERGLRPVVEIYTPTIEQFLREFPDSDTVFMLPDNLELIRERMLARGDAPEKVDYRIQGAIAEMDYFRENAQHLYQRTYSVNGNDLSEIVHGIFELRQLNDNNELKNQVK